MKRIQTGTLLVALIGWSSLATESVVAQKRATPQTPSDSKPNGISENNGVIRIPLGALRIEIDDENQPFRLVNLDRRFESMALARFLTAYVEQSRHVTIIVSSNTKRLVEDEQKFNEFLEQLGNGKKALILHMPPPTGFDPDAALREFAAAFLTEPNPEQIQSPRTKR